MLFPLQLLVYLFSFLALQRLSRFDSSPEVLEHAFELFGAPLSSLRWWWEGDVPKRYR